MSYVCVCANLQLIYPCACGNLQTLRFSPDFTSFFMFISFLMQFPGTPFLNCQTGSPGKCPGLHGPRSSPGKAPNLCRFPITNAESRGLIDIILGQKQFAHLNQWVKMSIEIKLYWDLCLHVPYLHIFTISRYLDFIYARIIIHDTSRANPVKKFLRHSGWAPGPRSSNLLQTWQLSTRIGLEKSEVDSCQKKTSSTCAKQKLERRFSLNMNEDDSTKPCHTLTWQMENIYIIYNLPIFNGETIVSAPLHPRSFLYRATFYHPDRHICNLISPTTWRQMVAYPMKPLLRVSVVWVDSEQMSNPSRLSHHNACDRQVIPVVRNSWKSWWKWRSFQPPKRAFGGRVTGRPCGGHASLGLLLVTLLDGLTLGHTRTRAELRTGSLRWKDSNIH